MQLCKMGAGSLNGKAHRAHGLAINQSAYAGTQHRRKTVDRGNRAMPNCHKCDAARIRPIIPACVAVGCQSRRVVRPIGLSVPGDMTWAAERWQQRVLDAGAGIEKDMLSSGLETVAKAVRERIGTR